MFASLRITLYITLVLFCMEFEKCDCAYYTIHETSFSSYVNNYDSSHTTTSYGSNRVFCGVGGRHDNHKEDRQYKFQYCYPSTTISMSTTSWSSYTSYDATWTRECNDDYFISGWRSSHDNHREDRKFSFKCSKYSNSDSRNCYWTGYVNSWDSTFTWECNNEYAIAGISSYHDNHKEDRRFKFKCCRLYIPIPTPKPTKQPTRKPTPKPTYRPTKQPTRKPTHRPTRQPTKKPTTIPTKYPSTNPTKYPSTNPSKYPSEFPSNIPTQNPTNVPSVSPTNHPTLSPEVINCGNYLSYNLAIRTQDISGGESDGTFYIKGYSEATKKWTDYEKLNNSPCNDFIRGKVDTFNVFYNGTDISKIIIWSCNSDGLAISEIGIKNTNDNSYKWTKSFCNDLCDGGIDNTCTEVNDYIWLDSDINCGKVLKITLGNEIGTSFIDNQINDVSRCQFVM